MKYYVVHSSVGYPVVDEQEPSRGARWPYFGTCSLNPIPVCYYGVFCMVPLGSRASICDPASVVGTATVDARRFARSATRLWFQHNPSVVRVARRRRTSPPVLHCPQNKYMRYGLQRQILLKPRFCQNRPLIIPVSALFRGRRAPHRSLKTTSHARRNPAKS